MNNKVEVSDLKRVGSMVKGRVRISYDAEVAIGYSGNADDEQLSKYLIESAMQYFADELLEQE